MSTQMAESSSFQFPFAQWTGSALALTEWNEFELELRLTLTVALGAAADRFGPEGPQEKGRSTGQRRSAAGIRLSASRTQLSGVIQL